MRYHRIALTSLPLPTDAVVRPAIVTTAATLDDTRDSLVRLLSPRVPRVSAVTLSDLASAGRSFSSLVVLRPAGAPKASPDEAADGAGEAKEVVNKETDAEFLVTEASRLDRRLPGYVVDVSVGRRAGSAEGDAATPELYRLTEKWLCRVNCAEIPADGGSRLGALLTAVLLSEEDVFHGQVLRL